MLRLAILLLCIAPAAVFAQDTFSGIVQPELDTPDREGTLTLCKRSAAPEVLASGNQANTFDCTASWFLRGGQLRVPLRLIEPSGEGGETLLVDVDQDGSFSDSERFQFRKHAGRFSRARVDLTIPTRPGSPFSRFPVVVQIPNERAYARVKPLLPSLSTDERYLFHSLLVFATAKVRIAGRDHFFRYSVSADTEEIDLQRGIQSVDLGEIQDSPLSPFYRSALGDKPVFRLRDRYVSTERVDLHKRVAVIRQVGRLAYRRLELGPGLTVPDFSFRDVYGRTRSLAEFHGKHVLLLFWMRGCVPCEVQTAQAALARERFDPERLAIVGFVHDGTPAEALRSLVAPDGPFDALAARAGAQLLVDQWFAISSWPTQILINPEGRIVSINQQDFGKYPLYGDQLLITLDSLLRQR